MPEDLIQDQNTQPESVEEVTDFEGMYDPEIEEPETPEEAPVPTDVAETVEAEAAPETPEPPTPFSYVPQIPGAVFSEQEQTWIDENIDPQVQNWAMTMAERIAQRMMSAQLVAQSSVAALPAPFMSVYGTVVAEALNALPVTERGTEDARNRAISAAFWQRSKQVGPAVTAQEFAQLLGNQEAPKPPSPKPIIPADQRAVVPTVTVPTIQNTRTNGNRTGRGRVLAGLGIEDD